MSAKHTPGPWFDDGYRIRAPHDGDPRCGRIIVEYKYAEGFNNADARLIAASPDLMAALEQIERLSREANGSLVDVRAMLGDIARAAIVKARGR